MQRMLREKKPANWPCEIVILLVLIGKHGIPLLSGDSGHKKLPILGRHVRHRILDASPVDPIIHLGLGDCKRCRVLMPGKGRNSDDDHNAIVHRVSTGDVGLGGEDLSYVRHASNYTHSEGVSTTESVFFQIV